MNAEKDKENDVVFEYTSPYSCLIALNCSFQAFSDYNPTPQYDECSLHKRHVS